MNYTLIAYRPDGADYCRGCLMGQSSSSFNLTVTSDREEVVEAWAQCLVEDEEHELSYCDWEVELLFGGRKPGEYDDDLEGEAWVAEHSRAEAEWKEHDAIKSEASARAAKVVKANKEKKEAEAARLRVLEQKRRTEVERAEYERLRQRFG